MSARWAVGIGVLVVALLGAAEAAGTRIGYVDVQRVLVRSLAGVAARDQLEREKVTLQKDIDARRAEIDKLHEELERKGLVLSPEARREKDEALQRKVRDYKRLAEDAEKEVQRREQVVVQKMIQELGPLIERFGKEGGFLLIVERRGAGVIYGEPESDVTDEVIKLYDQEKAKEKK